jgi:hypothetical protein
MTPTSASTPTQRRRRRRLLTALLAGVVSCAVALLAPGGATANANADRTTRAQPITWNEDGTPNLGVPVAPGEELAGPSGE